MYWPPLCTIVERIPLFQGYENIFRRRVALLLFAIDPIIVVAHLCAATDGTPALYKRVKRKSLSVVVLHF